ncbi:MAG: lipopolysaccharide biosynthesis protein [Phycisphaerae bacterium]|nr:lipopolysaccharide biosynthesis protein [Phycisphaerae bacterium]
MTIELSGTTGHTNLKHRAIRGGAFTFASQWTRFVLRIGSMVVLSRLLVKEDFGLLAMVTAFTGFASLFADAGLTQAATRSKNLSHQQATSLFWINLGVATLVAGILAACAPLVAMFYAQAGVADARLIPITIVASVSLVVGALGAQHQAMLQRELKFGWLAGVEIASQVVGTAAAISIAAIWHTYWALVAQLVVTRAVATVVAWMATRWRPSLPAIARGTRSLVTTGSHLTGTEVLNYVQVNADSVILGRFDGPGPLGEYSRALSLLLMPLTQVIAPFTKVAVPLLSRLQDQPERFARAYYRMAALVAILTTPLIAILMMGSRDLIRLALGPNFEQAGTLFQILSLASWGMPIAATATWVAIATGQTKELMFRNAVKTVIFITAYLIGVRWSAVGVAWAYVVATHVVRGPMLSRTLAKTPVSMRGLIKATWPGTLIGVLGAVSMAVPAYLVPESILPRPWISLAATVAVGVAVMSAVGWFWPRARREAREALDIVRSLRAKSASTTPTSGNPMSGETPAIGG